MGSKYVGLEVLTFAAGIGSEAFSDMESFNITADLECFPCLAKGLRFSVIDSPVFSADGNFLSNTSLVGC